jgi:hypothetical protein
MSNSKSLNVDFNFRTKDGYKRPTVSLEVPVPTAEGVAELLVHEDAKVVCLVVDTVAAVLTSYVRGFVDADADFDQAKLEALIADGKVSIETIANLPKSERSMLTKEDLEGFAKDYISIMPEATGKSIEKVTAAAGLFIERYKRAAGDNEVLTVLRDQLAVFIDHATPDMLETHERAISYLATKVEELLSIKVTADAL